MGILVLLVTFVIAFIVAFILSIKYLNEKKYKLLMTTTAILIAVVFLVSGFIALCISALGSNHF